MAAELVAAVATPAAAQKTEAPLQGLDLPTRELEILAPPGAAEADEALPSLEDFALPDSDRQSLETVVDTASKQPIASMCESASTTQRRSDDKESRLEALLEQQNLLLSRQLSVAQESQQRAEDARMHCQQQPAAVLGALDPSVRRIFKQWRSDFQAQLRCYVELMKRAALYEETMEKGGLIRPFSQESQRAWQWPAFYRQAAQEIAGVEPLSGCGQAGMVEQVDGQARYCVDHAFQALREKHAQEAQAFIVAHHMRCVEMLSAELSLAKQTEMLLVKLAEWAALNTCCRPGVMQHIERQAKVFVDLIYRQEMPKMEAKLAVQGQPCVIAPAFMLFVRCSCALMVLLAVFLIDHDVLERVFSVFVAVLCGASLVWEDVIVRCVKTLFGDKSMRLLRSPTHVMIDLWRTS